MTSTGSQARPQSDLTKLANVRTAAVVAVDVQRAFTDLFSRPVSPSLGEVLPRITRFLREARKAGLPVFLVRTVVAPQEHSRNSLGWPEQTKANLAPQSPGIEFDPALEISTSDIEVIKKRHSAFFATPLDSFLRAKGIQTVIVLGLTTDVCVGCTVRDSWQLDYETITLADCCAEVGEGSHEAALKTLGRRFGIVTSSVDIVSAWELSSPRATLPL